MYSPALERRRRPWGILVALVVLAAVVVVVVVLVFGGYVGTSPGHPGFGVWGGFLLLFLVLWVAFFAVRVMFWTRAARYRRGPSDFPRRDPAVMVARQRYARGEITREQYDQILTDLERRRTLP